MALYSISGIGCCCNTTGVKDAFGQIELDSIGRRNRSQRKAKRQAKRSQRKAKRKDRRDRRRYGENCKGRTGAKIALTLARRAYLLLLRLNVKNMAVKMNAVLSNPDTRKKAIEKWCRLGGNASLLKSTTAKAYSKYKRKRGISGSDELAFIGVEPASATLLAQALPILKALAPLLSAIAPLLKKSGELNEGDSGEVEETESTSESSSSSESDSESNSVNGMSNKNMLLIGAGLIGAYYLLKKKK